MTRSGPVIIVVIVVIIATLLWAAGQSWSAATQCAPREKIETAIAARFGEHADRMGLSGGNMVKWYVNPTTGSWTMLIITPGGTACIMAVGEAMQTIKPTKLLKPGNFT